ncbi:MAG: alpha/beta hydrolase [Rubripirellula sp.]
MTPPSSGRFLSTKSDPPEQDRLVPAGLFTSFCKPAGNIMRHLLCFLLLLSACSFCDAVPPSDAHIYKKIEDRELNLYVTKPADWTESDTRPAIVFFHGGGWIGGKPGQFSDHAEHFSKRGLVCFQVEYRLLDKKKKLPPVTCTQDAKSAMRWIRSRSGEFGIDPNRIASGGGSAGGHLAAFVGTVDGGDAPDDDASVSAKSNAMLLFNPVYNNGPEGWGASRVRERFPEFSPAHNLSKDDPPSIVFLGSQDKLIPVSIAEKFRDDSHAVGVTSELHVYEGQGHGFFNSNKDDGKWYRKTVAAADSFLVKQGWLVPTGQ